MPYVMKHQRTNQVFSCKLINTYDLEYYGVQFWEDREEAEAEYAPFLTSRGIKDADWGILEVDEMLLKMFNVKLNNNESKRVYINEHGKAEAKVAEGDALQ